MLPNLHYQAKKHTLIHTQSIRRAAVNTFGYIAKAIGPQDVLVTLLNNLKVQVWFVYVCEWDVVLGFVWVT